MDAVASRNIEFISHSDQGGRGDGVQVMVKSRLCLYRPRLLERPDTRAIHLQTHDDLLLAVNGPSMWTMQVDAQAYYSGSPADLLKGRQYTAGVRVFDIPHPEAPREIAFMATEGVGPHR